MIATGKSYEEGVAVRLVMIPVVYTCLFYLFHYIVQDAQGIQVLRRMDNATSWPDAQSECVSAGGNLLLIDSYSIQSLDRCDITPDEAVWEGKYNTFSEWVIHIGCSELKNNNVNSMHTMTVPGSIECGELCRTTYFAIQNATCYCLRNNISSSKDSDDLCGYKCDLRKEPCGGNGAISVYSKVSTRDVRPREDDLQPFLITCGLAECTPPDWRLYGYPCDRSLKGFCSDDSVLSQNTHWETAQNTCWNSKNSSLHGYDLMSNVECNSTSSFKNLPLWIQMRRDKVTRVVDGRAVNPESTCYGGRINNGSFMSHEMDCNHKHAYICIIDIDNPNCTDCLFNRSIASIPCPTPTEVTSNKRQEGQKDKKDSITHETIAAVVGSVVAAVIVIGIILIYLKRRSRLREEKQPRGNYEQTVNGAEGSKRTSWENEYDNVNISAPFDADKQDNNSISNDATLLVRPTTIPNRQTDINVVVQNNDPDLKMILNEKCFDENDVVKETQPEEPTFILQDEIGLDNEQAGQNKNDNVKPTDTTAVCDEGQLTSGHCEFVKPNVCRETEPVHTSYSSVPKPDNETKHTSVCSISSKPINETENASVGIDSSKPYNETECTSVRTVSSKPDNESKHTSFRTDSSKPKNVSVINVCAHPPEDHITKL